MFMLPRMMANAAFTVTLKVKKCIYEVRPLKKVYIVHPLRGDIENNEDRIGKLCRQIVDTEPGILPLSPILAFNFFDPNTEPAKAMQYCLELLACADELWVYREWWKSEGCQAEICFAGCRGIPIRFKDTPPGATDIPQTLFHRTH
jgi:Domain of unknown function (DUF4406)